MIKELELFNDAGNWTSSDVGLTVTDSSMKSFLIGGSSIKLSAIKDIKNSYIEQIYGTAFDVTEYNELRFQIISRNYQNYKYTKPEHFTISIELWDGATPYKWFVPVYDPVWNCVVLDITDIDSFNRIRFVIETDLQEDFWIDYMTAITPEMTLDLLTEVSKIYDDVIPFTTVNLTAPASTGDESIAVGINSDFINAHSLIEIKEGINVEQHQLSEAPMNGVLRFTKLRDGLTLKNNYTTAATIRLIIPADFKNVVNEIYMPGYSIWGFNPQRAIERETETTELSDFIKAAQNKVRGSKSVRHFDLMVQITLESWHLEIVELMDSKFRETLGNDAFFHIGGLPIEYEVSERIFQQGDNESPSMAVMTINFWTMESYERGELHALTKTITATVDINNAEDII